MKKLLTGENAVLLVLGVILFTLFATSSSYAIPVLLGVVAFSFVYCLVPAPMQRSMPTGAVSRPEWHVTLGISAKAPHKEVQARYRTLVKRYHPDINPGNDEAAERFKAIGTAYKDYINQRKK